MDIGEITSPEIRLRYAFIGLAFILIFGTFGYMMIEEWRLIDALYMTVITLTTVGFGEVHTLTPGGRVFTMCLAIGGMGTMAYTALVVTQILLDRQVHKVLGRRRMDRKLRNLKGHIIVCSHGRVGRQICAELKARGAEFVVIEKDPVVAHVLPEYHFVAGDATEESILQKARVEHAAKLISALPNEADNVYVTLTARQLNSSIFITIRAESAEMEPKLKRAGADRVVCPHRAGARRMAVITLQPNVMDFMDILAGDEGTGLRLEEIPVNSGSKFIGQTLQEIELSEKYAVSVIGINRRGDRRILHPGSDEKIEEGDVLLLIGAPERLGTLLQDFTDRKEA